MQTLKIHNSENWIIFMQFKTSSTTQKLFEAGTVELVKE